MILVEFIEESPLQKTIKHIEGIGDIEVVNGLFVPMTYDKFALVFSLYPDINPDEFVNEIREYHSKFKKYIKNVYVRGVSLREFLLVKLLIDTKDDKKIVFDVSYGNNEFKTTLDILLKRIGINKRELSPKKIKLLNTIPDMTNLFRIDNFIVYIDEDVFIISYEEPEFIKSLIGKIQSLKNNIMGYGTILESILYELTMIETVVYIDNLLLIFHKIGNYKSYYLFEITKNGIRGIIRKSVPVNSSVESYVSGSVNGVIMSFQDVVVIVYEVVNDIVIYEIVDTTRHNSVFIIPGRMIIATFYKKLLIKKIQYYGIEMTMYDFTNKIRKIHSVYYSFKLKTKS